MPVSEPIRSVAGETLVEADGRTFTLSPQLGLGRPREDNPPWQDAAWSYGQAIADLHIALASFPRDRIPDGLHVNHPVSICFEHCVPQLIEGLEGTEREQFVAMVESIETDMRSALADLATLLIHRNCHGGNIIREGKEASVSRIVTT